MLAVWTVTRLCVHAAFIPIRHSFRFRALGRARMCLSGGQEPHPQPPWPPPSPPSPVAHLSHEYVELCTSQFELLGTILNASSCVLYLRQEAASGALEFSPFAVWPGRPRVWVAHAESPGEGLGTRSGDGDSIAADTRPTVRDAMSELSGSLGAPALIPEYPFVSGLGHDAGMGVEVGVSHELADGGLSVPLQYGSIVLGMLAVWRGANHAGSLTRSATESDSITSITSGVAISDRDNASVWSPNERDQVAQVASSLALALVIDQVGGLHAPMVLTV